MNKFDMLYESLLKGGNLKELAEFIEKRLQGALKIKQAAEAKGGAAMLTAIHFKAKEIPYEHSIEATKNKDFNLIEKKANECLDKLKSWNKMTQNEFQDIMGQLEAYGEVFIRSTTVENN
jgi:hypothetical protein